jgi:hypothetical protein
MIKAHVTNGKGARAKQPYAIAMKDGSPFGLAGLWESWRNPNTGEWEGIFAIITVPRSHRQGVAHCFGSTAGTWIINRPTRRSHTSSQSLQSN